MGNDMNTYIYNARSNTMSSMKCYIYKTLKKFNILLEKKN